MLALVRTPSGATCKGVLQLEATFIEVKNMYLHQDSNPGLWHSTGTVFQRPGFESRWRYMFFTSTKVASSWRMPLQVVPEGVLI